MTVYEKPEAARLILARALGISTDEAALAIAALIEGGYGVAPRNPTNGMLAAYLEALTPPTGHEQVITAISKARLRWTAMLEQGTAMAMTRKALPTPDRSGEADKTAKQGLAEGESGLPRKGSSKPFPSCNVPRCDNPAIQDDLCRKHLEEHRDNGGVS